MFPSNKKEACDGGEKWSSWCRERDCALINIFLCGSINMLEGSRASNLASLGVGLEERHLQFCFPISGDMLFSKLSGTLDLLFKFWK